MLIALKKRLEPMSLLVFVGLSRQAHFFFFNLETPVSFI